MENNFAQNKFNIATTEVLYIIKYFFSTYSKSKIPEKFIVFLKENAISDYKPEFDITKNIADLQLSSETKSLLALVYRDYLCTEEEKQEFNKSLIENEEKKQKELREKYNPDNIFKNKKEDLTCKTKTLPIEKKQDSIFKKIIDYIKSLFRK